MQNLRRRLGFDRASDEAGLSLVEVMVAMMIFTIITTGLLYTMLNLLSVTRDSRARQVATNLAAQEIDLVRDASDVFIVGDRPSTVVLNGDTFKIMRSSSWVVNGTSTTACGTGSTAATGTLRFKQVHVQVTWGGMRKGALPVVSDTLINPNDRLSDPEKSTILVSVLTSAGLPVAGATVTAKQTPSGQTYTATTDAQGCAFMLKVVAGDYNVIVTSSTGLYVDETGVAASTKLVSAAAGSSAAAAFTYDKAGYFNVTYSASGAALPLNMPTALLSTRAQVTYDASTAANPRKLSVHPWKDGYNVVGGNPAQCPAADPALWDASGTKADGERAPIVLATSGETLNMTSPLSTVKVDGLSGTVYVLAMTKYVAPSAGRPICAPDASDANSTNLVTQYYRFAATTSGSLTIALPYGSYEIYTSKIANFVPPSATGNVGTKVTSANLKNPSTGSVSSSGIVTFDPRVG